MVMFLGNPERHFVKALNISGTTLLRGTPVVFDTQTPDGIRVTLPVAATIGLFFGVTYGLLNTTADVPDGQYARFQVGGYCDYARVIGDGASTTAIGDKLKLVAAQSYFTRAAAPDGLPAFAIAVEVVSIGAAVAARKVILNGVW